MLISLDQIREPGKTNFDNKKDEPEAVVPPVLCLSSPVYRNIANPQGTLQNQIGTLEHNVCINFWSFGSYSLHELLFYLLKQTGPAHINMCTWSISQDAIERIIFRHNRGDILSIRFLLDPRVKVCKAKPLQMIAANFPYGITRIHAKVVTLENKEWKLSIVTSQNATNNPKLERGVILVSDLVCDFDQKIFEDEFNRCRVENSGGVGGIVLQSDANSLDS
ncbi:MAG: hypothetical protein RSA53_10510 [Odoribacter sp.]